MRLPLSSTLTLSLIAMALPTGQATAAIADSFVQVSGTKFTCDGKDFRFVGTNCYELGLLNSWVTEAIIDKGLTQIANSGIKVVRMWGFCNGYDHTGSRSPMQKNYPGDYDQAALQRLDYTIACAGWKGLKVILVMGNYEPEFGGNDWYAQKLKGVANNRTLFFTDTDIKASYKNWLSYMMNRANTRNGKQYKNDPAIMAVELLNEPHTPDDFESTNKGTIVYNWLAEMASYVRNTLHISQLISTGEEGYRTDGRLDVGNTWINNGQKGCDWKRDLSIPEVSFGTLHVYPDNWAIPYANRSWVFDNFVLDRKSVADAANKPLIIEESGFGRSFGYLTSATRNTLLNELFSYSNQKNIQGLLVWALQPYNGTGESPSWGWDVPDTSGYEFDIRDDGAQSIMSWASTWNTTSSYTVTAQAEDGSLNNTQKQTSIAGYQGSGYVGGFDATGDYVDSWPWVPSAGNYNVSIRYQIPSGWGTKYNSVYLNGTKLGQKTFASTGTWTTLNLGSLWLINGSNRVTVKQDSGDWGSVFIDSVTASR